MSNPETPHPGSSPQSDANQTAQRQNPSDPLLNSRPISLYEVLRKVWTGIISSRIHKVLHQTGLLESLQDVFRFGKGTPQTLHRMVKILEQASAESSPLNLVFWDTRRAFDSVS
jgi:hypothetical protein